MLPGKIEQLERQVQQLTDEMSSPEFFRQDRERIVSRQKALEAANAELETCYERWEELESIQFRICND